MVQSMSFTVHIRRLATAGKAECRNSITGYLDKHLFYY
ncbi:hypothetical protein BVRB_4g071350 isoform A [Beta vulgaris subsp. vulgaris]|nr:hypothetical protein BVRB_4g071350 isoform A [Beta vulgaris subsp. vulgaris]